MSYMINANTKAKYNGNRSKVVKYHIVQLDICAETNIIKFKTTSHQKKQM